jgi:CDP-diacylglycerol--glycerol-3-phosphate 3-phosphatidyltransferase
MKGKVPMRGRVARAGETPASTGNVANIITVVRILLAPLFIWLLLVDGGEDGLLRYLAAGLFVLAIVTDSVDGLLARRQNLVTDFGKLLDPIADKVLIGGALVALSILGELPWWVTIVILVREIGITVYRFIALRDRVIPASWFGKLKTVFQAIAIAFALTPVYQWLPMPWWPGFIDIVNTVLMSIALVLTVVSGIEYLVQAWRLRPSAGHAQK